MATSTGAGRSAARQGDLRVWSETEVRVLPNKLNRLAAVSGGSRLTKEVAVVGFEGMLGICIFMGGGSMPIRAVVQIACMGYRLSADAFMDESERSIPVRYRVLRYAKPW